MADTLVSPSLILHQMNKEKRGQESLGEKPFVYHRLLYPQWRNVFRAVRSSQCFLQLVWRLLIRRGSKKIVPITLLLLPTEYMSVTARA